MNTTTQPKEKAAPVVLPVELRDYFAAKAMQAMLTNVNVAEAPNEKISEWAYQMADAMLAARAKS